MAHDIGIYETGSRAGSRRDSGAKRARTDGVHPCDGRGVRTDGLTGEGKGAGPDPVRVAACVAAVAPVIAVAVAAFDDEVAVIAGVVAGIADDAVHVAGGAGTEEQCCGGRDGEEELAGDVADGVCFHGGVFV